MSNKSLVLFIAVSIVILLICFSIIFAFNDYIFIPSANFLKHMERGEDYWMSYLNSYNETDSIVEQSLIIANRVFDFSLVLMFVYLLDKEKHTKLLNKKKIIYLFFLMGLAYLIQKYITYTMIYHYKIYMIFFTTTILAVGLLFLSISVLRKIR